jgi:hypothetical protein
MVWAKAGTTTLSSSGSNMEITGMTASKSNQILCHVSGTSASTFCETLFNSDTTSSYANRASQNGGTDFTRINSADLNMFESYSNTTGAFLVSYFGNITTEEKLGISQSVRVGTAGAGNAPARDENAYKWVNTSAQITSSSFTPQSGTVNTDSNLSVLGSDLTPASAVAKLDSLSNTQAGSRWEETDTRKMYHYESPSVTYETDFSTTTNWTKTGTAQDITGGELAMQAQQGHGIQAEVYDLGTALSDSAWTIKFKIHCTSFTTSGAPSAVLIMGMSSISTGNNLTAQDFIGCRIETSASLTPALRTQDTDGASIPDTWDASSSYAFAAADTRYIQLTRLTSTSFSIKIYSDSTYSTLVETVTGVCASGITGLRYFSVEGYSGGSANSSTFVGEMDDLKIYNGVTSTDKVWSEEGT